MSQVELLHNAIPQLPDDIIDAIENEYANLTTRYYRQDWGPAELNGGRFAEAILRYLEWRESGGKYTPIGTQLNRQEIIRRVTNNINVPDGLRLHVTRCVELLMDIRNRRDVAHLGAIIDINEMDSRVVMRLASWILSEIIREESRLKPEEVQSLIDQLSTKEIPLIEEITGDLIVLASSFSAKDKALIALYSQYPNPLEIRNLQQAVNYSNLSRFRDIIKSLAQNRITYIKEDQVYLTRKGVAWVEKNINLKLDLST